MNLSDMDIFIFYFLEADADLDIWQNKTSNTDLTGHLSLYI